MAPRTAPEAYERLLLSAERGAGECLLLPPRNGAKGYRRVSADGKNILAHRLVVQVLSGRELLPNETVDHLCHNWDPDCPGGPDCPHRRCINPDHLGVTDSVTNWLRAGSWKRRRKRS